MRRHLILAAFAGFVGVAACCGSASAGGNDEYPAYRERWYKSYERRREARERRREAREDRIYTRAMRYQEREATRRHYRHYRHDYGYYPRHRYYDRYAYNSYNSYYDDDYEYAPRYYNYYGYPRRYHRHNIPAHTNAPGGPDEWNANDYPIGWRSWWSRMDNDGRGGRQ